MKHGSASLFNVMVGHLFVVATGVACVNAYAQVIPAGEEPLSEMEKLRLSVAAIGEVETLIEPGLRKLPPAEQLSFMQNTGHEVRIHKTKIRMPMPDGFVWFTDHYGTLWEIQSQADAQKEGLTVAKFFLESEAEKYHTGKSDELDGGGFLEVRISDLEVFEESRVEDYEAIARDFRQESIDAAEQAKHQEFELPVDGGALRFRIEEIKLSDERVIGGRARVFSTETKFKSVSDTGSGDEFARVGAVGVALVKDKVLVLNYAAKKGEWARTCEKIVSDYVEKLLRVNGEPVAKAEESTVGGATPENLVGTKPAGSQASWESATAVVVGSLIGAWLLFIVGFVVYRMTRPSDPV